MDSRLNDAARALAEGDALRALNLVAIGDDALSLALRGSAFAQLGELAEARRLLGRALRAFAPADALSRARCVLALGEVALAARELRVHRETLKSALRTLEAEGDRPNALHARLVLARAALLSGRPEDAGEDLGEVRLRNAPPMLVALTELVRAELALQRMDVQGVEAALERARRASERAAIPSLQREVEKQLESLEAPAARLVSAGRVEPLRLADVSRLLSGEAYVVDACRRVLSRKDLRVDFSRRPVLFSLLRTLGEAWPERAARDALIQNAFGVAHGNESHRARLRVELGRLRKKLDGVGELAAMPGGYRLQLRQKAALVVLAPPVEGDAAALMALLRDGTAWTTSALALALGTSQRTLQRLLGLALEEGRVYAVGKGPARRWFSTPIRYATGLLPPFAPGVG